MLDEPTAKAVWLRAAQLQADASRRVQERTAQAEEFATGLHSAVPTSGYRIGDVESAAVEAGSASSLFSSRLPSCPMMPPASRRGSTRAVLLSSVWSLGMRSNRSGSRGSSRRVHVSCSMP